MAKLPSKKIIRLMIFLVIIIIGVFWYLGYQNKQTEDQKLALYRQQILERQRNLENIIQQGSSDHSDWPELQANWSEIELSLLESPTQEELKAYGQDLAKGLKPFSLKRNSEIKLALAALDHNDNTKIKDLVAARLNHEIAAASLRQTTVPTEIADQHRRLINSLENSALLLGQMEKILSEPVAGLEASRLFLQETVFFYQIIDKINDYFRLKGIDFPEEEKLKLYVNFNQ